jgi:integrase
LASFWRFLVRNDYSPASPLVKIKRPKVVPIRYRKRVRFTTAQMQEMLDACETWPERLCLHTLAHTGLRRTALAMARWGDLDGKAWTLEVIEKGEKTRKIPVPKALRKLYMEYWNEHPDLQPEHWIVPSRDGRHRPARSCRVVYSLVKGVAGRCGIEAHAHAFRAGFAIWFLEHYPNSILTLSSLLGHSSVAVTQASYATDFADRLAAESVIDLGGDVEAVSA